MPRKTRPSTFSADAVSNADTREKYPAPVKPRYINVYLNEQDIEWLESNYASANDSFADFADEIPATYGLSLYQDSQSGKWNAILSCSDDYDPNNGHKLSVRVSSPFDALFALAYVHVVKLQKRWVNHTDTSRSRWG